MSCHHFTTPRKTFVRVAGSLALLLAALPSHAVQREWLAANSGLFTDPQRWTPFGLPGSADVLLFRRGASAANRYTVGNVKGEVDRVWVMNDALSFDFNNVNQLLLRNGSAATPGLVIGQGPVGSAGDLVLAHGGALFSTDAVLAADVGVSGRLTAHGTEIDLARDLSVGRLGSGSVTLDSGAKLLVGGNSLLGEASTAVGTLELFGHGTSWRGSGDIVLGVAGIGTVSVVDGAAVRAQHNTVLGYFGGGRGALTVHGAQSNWMTSEMHVGYAGGGHGAVTLDSGGTIDSDLALVGSGVASEGDVIVDGLGSRWQTATLVVGHAGRGTLEVRNRGAMGAGLASIGAQADSEGVVSISGAGSAWSNAGALHIGERGRGVLNVIDAGRVDADTASLGTFSAAGGSVHIDGDGSLLAVAHLLDVGRAGDGDVWLTHGGRLTSGTARLGVAALSRGQVSIDGATSSWSNDGDLMLGDGGHGQLLITNGGRLANGFNGVLGNQAGSDGLLRIEGAGSNWTNSADIAIGFAGSGHVVVSGGATVNARNNTVLGHRAGSFGELELGGDGSRWDSREVHVGYVGNGRATLSDGAALNASALFIGAGTGTASSLALRDGARLESQGSAQLGAHGGGVSAVAIEGSGTSLRVHDTLLTGASGASVATMDIRAGASLNAGNTMLGGSALSNTTVTIDGTGSSWVSGAFTAGGLGKAVVNIRAGGLLSALQLSGNDNGTLNFDDGTLHLTGESVTYNRINLERGGGVFDVANALHELRIASSIGGEGSLTKSGAGTLSLTGHSTYRGMTFIQNGALRLLDGGRVEGGGVSLANRGGSFSAMLVRGTGTLWQADGGVVVGDGGSGGVQVDLGGALFSNFGVLANQDGGFGTTIVTDADSRWVISGALSVGMDGRGELSIERGGHVSSAFATVGLRSSGLASEVKVRDAGSSWATGEDLRIGFFADGRVSVVDGTLGVGRDLTLGFGSGQQGVLAVAGASARLSVGRDLIVGHFGEGVLSLTDGARMTSVGRTSLGNAIGAHGAMVIDRHAQWTSGGDIDIGYGASGDMRVESGGAVIADGDTFIGRLAGADGALELAGEGASWQTVAMHVGEQGRGRLTISSQAALASNVGVIGGALAGRGAMDVSGAGSLWRTNLLRVGDQGVGELQVADGATVSMVSASLGVEAAGVGSAIVRGAGSRWDTTGNLVIGGAGQGALRIENGAELSDAGASLADAFDSRADVTVSAARWTTLGVLEVGRRGDAALSIERGAEVINGFGAVGGEAGARGQVRVHGADSHWHNTNGLRIGVDGAASVEISDGARVTSNFASLASGAASHGSVRVQAEDAEWQVTLSLAMNGLGSATLDVEQGGSVRVGQSVLMDEGSRVNLRGGTLDASIINVGAGTFDFSGGRLQTSLFVGSLGNQGGTLAPGHSPGLAVITGDYTQLAAGTLEIELAGDDGNDALSVGGVARLDGTLLIKLNPDFDPVLGREFDFLFAEQGISGAFATVLAPSWNGKRLVLDTSIANHLRLAVTAVPVPPAVWMFGPALLVLGLARRRPRRTLSA